MTWEAKVKRYWAEIILGDKKGIRDRAVLFLLKMFSGLYYSGFELKRRLTWPKSLGAKVISVGNISLGGTGKTPMVIELTKLLQARGKKVAVLSRGYKSLYEHRMAVVSDGNRILLTPEEAGDEPYLLAQKLPEVPVIIGKNRLKTGNYAINKFGAQILVLDDGFQYWPLKRELDIVLIDASQPLQGEKLFPQGLLREPKSSLKRAHLLIITQADQSLRKARLVDELKLLNPQATILESVHQPLSLFSLQEQKDYPLKELKGKEVLALSSIGNPEPFETLLGRLGARSVVPLRFPDHHQYNHDDINRIETLAKRVDMIVTTEKDLVRLGKRFNLTFPLFALKIELEIGAKNVFEIFLQKYRLLSS